MTLEFTEDLSPFFVEREFAEPATVAGVAILAIFDDGYAEQDDIEGTSPKLTCRSSDLPGTLDEGDAATVAGKTYSVTTIQPDGTGVTVLELEYVSG
jgi:hypothetical protein